MYFSQYKIDSFALLKECLEPIGGNIEEFNEKYDEIEHLSEILLPLEIYFPENKDLEFIQNCL